jgi:hypothetical protein
MVLFREDARRVGRRVPHPTSQPRRFLQDWRFLKINRAAAGNGCAASACGVEGCCVAQRWVVVASGCRCSGNSLSSASLCSTRPSRASIYCVASQLRASSTHCVSASNWLKASYTAAGCSCWSAEVIAIAWEAVIRPQASYVAYGTIWFT